jgi:uncharacterized protein YhaN
VEKLYATVRRRVAGAPTPPAGAVTSRLALTALRSAAAAADPDLLADLALAERAVERRRQRAETARSELARLDTRDDRIDELRGRLDAASARAAAGGESAQRDPDERELEAAHQAAYTAVWQAPFDLAAATELIRRYEAAVRRRRRPEPPQ